MKPALHSLLTAALACALTGCHQMEKGEPQPVGQGTDPAVVRMNALPDVLTQVLDEGVGPIDVRQCVEGDTFCRYVRSVLADDADGSRKAMLEQVLADITPDLRIAAENHRPAPPGGPATQNVHRVYDPKHASDGFMPWVTTAALKSPIYALASATEVSVNILYIAIGYFHELIHHTRRKVSGSPFITDDMVFGTLTGRDVANAIACLLTSQGYYRKQIFQRFYAASDFGGTVSTPEGVLERWVRKAVLQTTGREATPQELDTYQSTTWVAGVRTAAYAMLRSPPARIQMIKGWFPELVHRELGVGESDWASFIVDPNFRADLAYLAIVKSTEYGATRSGAGALTSDERAVRTWIAALYLDLFGTVIAPDSVFIAGPLPPGNEGADPWITTWMKFQNPPNQAPRSVSETNFLFVDRILEVGKPQYPHYVARRAAQKLLHRAPTEAELAVICTAAMPICSSYEDIHSYYLSSKEYVDSAQ